MTNKLIVYMIDGVAADHYASDARRFPHFAALAARGFRVENLHAEALGTSLPGRTSMLTGVKADVSGVYGNKIYEKGEFRYATPDDIAVPTLPHLARQAGKTAACINAGMIRPEDVEIMVGPWWARGDMIQRARDYQPEQAGSGWLRVMNAPHSTAFVAACQSAGLPTSFPVGLDLQNRQTYPVFSLMSDLVAADWVGALAASPQAPDLIWAEFLVTDTFQHYHGYKSETAQWSLEQADMALGKILQHLRNAGVENQWNLVVMSDHGHSHMETAIFPHNIVPGVTMACEGGSLLVAPKSAEELALVREKLATYGVEQFPNDCVPAPLREQVFVFVAPYQTSFEENEAGQTQPTGKPKAISTHGIRPGWPGDDRFALFAGPHVPKGSALEADATQVAPTIAALLGLPLAGFPSAPIFQPVASRFSPAPLNPSATLPFG